MENNFDSSKYDDKYYNWFVKNTKDYIKTTMDWFIDTYKPKSIIDYGCGIGAYLESGFNKGVERLQGFDINGEILKKYTNPLIGKFITYTDCTEKINTDKYECIISIETAEHINPLKSEVFVMNLINSADENSLIIFSAAQPEQNGTGHINCQTKEFWIELFNTYGFGVDSQVTKEVSEKWKTLKAPKYVYNNLIIFKKDDL